MDLIIRKYHGREPYMFSLELRDHGPAETNYTNIGYLNKELAITLVNANLAYFLFKDQDPRVGNNPILDKIADLQKELDELKSKLES
jgi:hypothetical protein